MIHLKIQFLQGWRIILLGKQPRQVEILTKDETILEWMVEEVNKYQLWTQDKLYH